jgi:pimeloyl-ACP methyl ester carboxylesterase
MRLTADAAHPASRALSPRESGYADSGGVRIGYEVFGQGEETLLFLPPWSIVHSRFWKAQVPYLARHFRVVTFDPRGNGRSDRPDSPAGYGPHKDAADAVAVLDATGTPRCVFVAHCAIAGGALLLATDHPERVAGAVFMTPALPISPPRPERTGNDFEAVLPHYDGWAKANRHYWEQDFRGYLEFFFGRGLPEPHSTKQIEDAIGWALEGAPETLIHTIKAPDMGEAQARELMARLRCPLLVTQGDEDLLIAGDRGAAFAEATGAELVEFHGAGHLPNARHPVPFNLMLRDFAERVWQRPRHRPPWRRPLHRPKRALYVSSPIGLGHAWRDVAIARELRALHPGLEIDWLAQDPVTQVLERCGERIHPASRQLALESPHIAAEAHGHELNVFQAWRQMDEILLANFMLFHEVATEDPYDLWIGDEAWEVDYFLHENPELKTAAYAFLTDFVGWLPMPEGGADEIRLTADYNAEMIELVERFPRVRDRALFVGNPEDVVPHSFGPGLPRIAPWVDDHFEFTGYALGPGEPEDREALRAELGYAPGDRVCVVTVGGSGVGGGLLERVIAAFPEARRLIPGLRMVVVCGPRIDRGAFTNHEGLELHGYVHGLSRHLAACDIAIVQGGLATGMELAAAGRPFLSFPLARHFEQNIHVRHRLERYGAGRSMDYRTATPECIAAALAGELAQPRTPAPVERDGAARAARAIAELI